MLTDRTIHTGHRKISVRNRGGVSLTFARHRSEGPEERQALQGSGEGPHNGVSEGRKEQQVSRR